jgi:ribosomal protein S5
MRQGEDAVDEERMGLRTGFREVLLAGDMDGVVGVGFQKTHK